MSRKVWSQVAKETNFLNQQSRIRSVVSPPPLEMWCNIGSEFCIKVCRVGCWWREVALLQNCCRTLHHHQTTLHCTAAQCSGRIHRVKTFRYHTLKYFRFRCEADDLRVKKLVFIFTVVGFLSTATSIRSNKLETYWWMLLVTNNFSLNTLCQILLSIHDIQ